MHTSTLHTIHAHNECNVSICMQLQNVSCRTAVALRYFAQEKPHEHPTVAFLSLLYSRLHRTSSCLNGQNRPNE